MISSFCGRYCDPGPYPNSESAMSASVLLPQCETAVEQTLGPILASVHDRWMAEAETALGPVTDPQATFFQRWAAVRYLWDQFAERFTLEQELLNELYPFMTPELRERLGMQANRLTRLQQDLDRLAHQRGTAREVARKSRDLLEALRLWYAEVEFAAGEIRLEDIGFTASCLVERFSGPTWVEECFVD
jgi:hypothetical protein